MSKFILGFDPGGEQKTKFGWAVLGISGTNPVSVVKTGRAKNCVDAVKSAFIVANGSILAAGIDAPLYWVPQGKRAVDEHLEALHVNSLRGACLVQGLLTISQIRNCLADLPISESYPRWVKDKLCGEVGAPFERVLKNLPADEDERDAILASLSAFALYSSSINKPLVGWQNLNSLPGLSGNDQKNGGRVFLFGPAEYWMPVDKTR